MSHHHLQLRSLPDHHIVHSLQLVVGVVSSERYFRHGVANRCAALGKLEEILQVVEITGGLDKLFIAGETHSEIR